MRKLLVSIAIIILSGSSAFAQPSNDDCSNAQSLGTLPSPAPFRT